MFAYVEAELVQLYGVYLRRSVDHHVTALVVLREGDVVAYGLLSAEEGTDAVETEGKSSVRRCSELEGVDDESELVLGFFLSDAENL